MKSIQTPRTASKSSLLLKIAALFLCVPVTSLCQGRATIYGSVADPAGGGIPNATIIAQQQGVDQIRSTKSGADGTYVIPDLPVGTYRLSAEASGFKTFTEEGIQLQVDENRRILVRMSLGEVSENVTVAAEVVQV
ncbi:MAG: carboxypeptidase regulatory-like domain-containing protein, partial [Acidobacteriaceae bacterium]|nr:carboxypeptidase regulatory-like domain-containing protein [Acidobacteriaceae bacterium]